MKTYCKKSFLLTFCVLIPFYVFPQRLDEWNPGTKTYTGVVENKNDIKFIYGAASNADSIIKLSLMTYDLPTVGYSNVVKEEAWNEICHYKNLQGLELIDLFGNNFPTCICELPGLRFLSVRNNRLTNLPGDIVKLKDLEVLNLYWNADLKDIIGVEKLSRLRYLNLGGNPKLNFKDVFILLSNLPDLKVLELNFDQIKKIPPEIGMLKNLEELIIDNNLMSDLPDEIGKLKNLKRIVLTNNNFSAIPPVLTKLPNMTEINLSNTYEEDLDESLKGEYGHNKISKEQVSTFKKANPKITIITYDYQYGK
ncbi:MAG: leucine-rich repeat domain-containing protein [Bacteroidales bacterium]